MLNIIPPPAIAELPRPLFSRTAPPYNPDGSKCLATVLIDDEEEPSAPLEKSRFSRVDEAVPSARVGNVWSSTKARERRV